MVKLAIIGSRDLEKSKEIYKAIKILRTEFLIDITQIVSGDCPSGIDKCAKEVSIYMESKDLIKYGYKGFPADWDNLGKKAGVLRNQEIAEYADMCLAFVLNKSSGSMDCIKRFRSLNKPVIALHFTKKDNKVKAK